MFRTHTCGQLTAKDIDQTVTLSGWVDTRRDHGGIIFVDLRDRYGLTQIVFDPEVSESAHGGGEKIRPEWVISVTGKVQARREGMTNDKMDTGEIELFVDEIKVLSEAQTPPFELDKDDVREDLRLEYRYLDLRRERMQKNLQLRHNIVKIVRDYFDGRDFWDIETPILVKGTPEGSREYLVPSRLHAGSFYVLPQSPQQLKQLLMVGGIDKYFQVPRCFRDEDLRGDRQPEFTQFEVEMSFVEQDDVMDNVEMCFHELMEKLGQDREWKKFLVDEKFKRITWQEAMEKYGSDKPDLRFDLEFVDVSEEAKTSGFGIFEKSDRVFALPAPKAHGELSRKDIDALTDLARENGAGGLAWYRVGDESGPVAKNSTPEFLEALKTKTSSEDGDLIFFGAGDFLTAVEPLGAVRSALGDKFELKNQKEFCYLWVYDFPMYEAKEDGSVQAAHHPFTHPKVEDIPLLDTDPMAVRAYAYDVVMNGVELGGGSIRIHDQKLQHKIFQGLGLNEEEIQKKFGHMLKAFSYGCPPHGGCAMGLDRVVMLFADEPNIREVIAFPKNQSAQDLMLGSPSAMPEKEVAEQNIRVIEE